MQFVAKRIGHNPNDTDHTVDRHPATEPGAEREAERQVEREEPDRAAQLGSAQPVTGGDEPVAEPIAR